MNPDDSFLVSMIVRGDKQSFELLYKKYFDRLIRFALYRTHSIDTSRDLVHDIFLKLWLNKNNLNPHKSIQAYLYKSLTNSIINHFKLISTKNITLEDLHSHTSNQESVEIKIDIHKALSRLPEKLQTVFILTRYEGYKYSEVADICGISVKAVEKRMGLVLKILRKIFSEKR